MNRNDFTNITGVIYYVQRRSLIRISNQLNRNNGIYFSISSSAQTNYTSLRVIFLRRTIKTTNDITLHPSSSRTAIFQSNNVSYRIRFSFRTTTLERDNLISCGNNCTWDGVLNSNCFDGCSCRNDNCSGIFGRRSCWLCSIGGIVNISTFGSASQSYVLSGIINTFSQREGRILGSSGNGLIELNLRNLHVMSRSNFQHINGTSSLACRSNIEYA